MRPVYGACLPGTAVRNLGEPFLLHGEALMAGVTVASLNIRGVPLTGSRLAARCHTIGAFFEASDVDVACLQEVHTYAHLALLARQVRSFRYVSFRRALPGPSSELAAQHVPRGPTAGLKCS
jgi:hypothetical protein